MDEEVDTRTVTPDSQSADEAWRSPGLRWRILAIPVAGALLGVACVAAADFFSSRGATWSQPLWWIGALAIFAPAAFTMLSAPLTRREAAFILIAVGMALYAVKLVYAPGRFWEFDELLHYPNVEAVLTSHRLFTPNSLLPISPYYPGLETVAAVIVELTGLPIIQAGLVLVGVAHALMVGALFLLLERVAIPPRYAATASLIYLACPAFLYFDSQFAYESLALALTVGCLFALRAAQLEDALPRRRRLEMLGALLMLAVIITHHVTSIALVVILLIWTLGESLAARNARSRWLAAAAENAETPVDTAGEPPERTLPGSGWVPILGVVALIGWFLAVASATVSYLGPQIASGLAELVRIIRLEETGRTLFQSGGGSSAPLLERVVGIGSVILIIALIPVGFRYLWRRTEYVALSRIFALGSLTYPAVLALHLTRSGWEVGSRATAFVYIPLSLTVAASLRLFTDRAARPTAFRVVSAALAAVLIFAGGIIAVTSVYSRQPAPYDPGRAWTPYDVESLAAAQWAAGELGPGHRIAADSASGALMGSLGRQIVVASKGKTSISQLFLSPNFGPLETKIAKDGGIGYVVVDRRISGAKPVKGYVFEKWEQSVQPYRSSVASDTVNKFEQLYNASKVFDSGNIRFFDLSRLVQ